MAGLPQWAWFEGHGSLTLLHVQTASEDGHMTPQPAPTEIRFELPDPVDMVAIERRARELRARAFADGVRALGQWAARRIAAFRLPAGSRPA